MGRKCQHSNSDGRFIGRKMKIVEYFMLQNPGGLVVKCYFYFNNTCFKYNALDVFYARAHRFDDNMHHEESNNLFYANTYINSACNQADKTRMCFGFGGGVYICQSSLFLLTMKFLYVNVKR